jgi:hypothetical protein
MQLIGRTEERSKRDIVLYKAYRRQFEKTMPGSRKAISALIRTYTDPSAPATISQTIAKSSREVKIIAVALIIITYTIGGRGGIHSYLSKHGTRDISDQFSSLFDAKGSRCLSPLISGAFVCSRSEQDWLLDHFVLDGIRGLFQEAVCRAREMIETGFGLFVDLKMCSSDAFPRSLGILGAGGRLEFWTIKPAEDVEQYRSEQGGMLRPMSLPIFYRFKRR